MADTGDGPTYQLLWALYLTAIAVTLATAGLLTTGARGATVPIVAVFGSTGLVAVSGTVLGRRGVPARLAPRPLYASGARLLPGLAGLGLAAVAVVLLFDPLHLALIPGGAALPLLFGGLVTAGVGGLIAIVAANVEARARLDGVEATEWRARPDARRRRAWYAVAVALAVVLLATFAVTRDVTPLIWVNCVAVVAARGHNSRRYWLTDEELCYGATETYRILDRTDIAGLRFEGDRLRIERRGWRPALTCDLGALDDPERIRRALLEERA